MRQGIHTAKPPIRCQHRDEPARKNLVDELRLMVFPIILGSGKRLYSESGKTAKLELTSSKALASGILLLTYHPTKAASREIR